MAHIELPGPPLHGPAIRLLQDRPAYNQKKGQYLNMPEPPLNETQDQVLAMDFTPKLLKVFGSVATAKTIRDQLAAKGIHTEVVIV